MYIHQIENKKITKRFKIKEEIKYDDEHSQCFIYPPPLPHPFAEGSFHLFFCMLPWHYLFIQL